MGLVDRLAGGTAYLDTNTFIYAIEGIEEFFPLVADLLPAVDRRELQAVTSELTLAETLVKPLRDGNEDLASDYVGTIQPRRALRVVPVSRDILIAAARVRATTALRLPDAIHAILDCLGLPSRAPPLAPAERLPLEGDFEPPPAFEE